MAGYGPLGKLAVTDGAPRRGSTMSHRGPTVAPSCQPPIGHPPHELREGWRCQYSTPPSTRCTDPASAGSKHRPLRQPLPAEIINGQCPPSHIACHPSPPLTASHPCQKISLNTYNKRAYHQTPSGRSHPYARYGLNNFDFFIQIPRFLSHFLQRRLKK